jgi:hypothetical protein
MLIFELNTLQRKCIEIFEIQLSILNMSNLNERMYKLCMGNCIKRIGPFFKKKLPVFNDTITVYIHNVDL